MRQTCTILVVEDDPHISDLITFLLQDAGYATKAANTAAKARHVVDERNIDLVILDWMLPDTPGDRLCKDIKQRHDQSYLPILMLTARSGLADRVAGLDAGADDFLTKPFHSDELLARVRALLRIRTAELERLQAIDELRAAYDQVASTQAQLVQTSRLAALGELVAGVAHELNNPLGIILGNAELLPALADTEDQRAVTQIIEAAQRSRRIVQSLVTFARQGKMERDWYKPSELIERVLDLKRADLHNREITLDVDYADGIPMLWADGAQIQQVLLNLLLNAEYAVQHQPQPQIRVRLSQRFGAIGLPPLIDEAEPIDQAAEGACLIVIDVLDNGVGIKDDVRAKLFQPFITTKPVGEGTGLGLAISYGIVAQHGGSLLVNSEPGRGGSFRVALPIGRDDAPPVEDGHQPIAFAEGGSILVVDDESHILDFVQRLLTRHGWQVQTTAQARSALALVDDQTFDMILCDTKMPNIDGSSFYQTLQRHHCCDGRQLILMTGDTSTTPTNDLFHAHELPVLRKPFTSQELLRVLNLASTHAGY